MTKDAGAGGLFPSLVDCGGKPDFIRTKLPGALIQSVSAGNYIRAGLQGGQFPLPTLCFPTTKLVSLWRSITLVLSFPFAIQFPFLALDFRIVRGSIQSIMEDNKEAGIPGLSPDCKPTQSDGMINDLEMDGLTLYEKKALLVNRELNSHGMGKYQWYLVMGDDISRPGSLIIFRSIFFLCGMGYMVDLLYAQAFGLVEPAMKQELGFSSAFLPEHALDQRLTLSQLLSPATSSRPSTQDFALG